MSTEATRVSETLPFEFTGRAGEYFKIWIVNIVLTILTLGIYSAWAKVRNKRYFYGNTRLDGSTFEYTAKPMTILKGRLIAFAVVAVYAVTVQFLPLAEPLFILAFVIALPWLVVRALAFNARNSVFKNIRFDFKSDYGEAFMVFIGFWLVTILTLGLAFPWFMYRQKRFIVANSAFGNTRFKYDAMVKSYYAVYLKALGMLILMLIAFMLVQSMTVMPAANATEPAEVSPEKMAMLMVPMLLLIPLYMFVGTYVQTAIANLFMNGSHIRQQRLHSSLKAGPMFWIYLSNLLVILLSLGLMIPWAKIRLARYRMENLSLQTDGQLDSFVAGMQQELKATGEELADVLDVDLGL